MARISKKTWPEYFELILQGQKKYDLRLNDFPVAEGDTLVLEEWDPKIGKYTGRSLEKEVGLVNRFKITEMFWSPEDINEKGLQIIGFK